MSQHQSFCDFVTGTENYVAQKVMAKVAIPTSRISHLYFSCHGNLTLKAADIQSQKFFNLKGKCDQIYFNE